MKKLLWPLIFLVPLGAQILRPIISGGRLPYDYYVSTAGNDGDTGRSPAHAFRTIGKAESTASNGQSVQIAAGTYTEDWTSAKAIKWSGLGTVTVRTVTLYSAITISANGAAYTGLTFDASTSPYDNVLMTGTAANLSFKNCNFVNIKSSVFESQGQMTGLTVTNPTITGAPTVAVFYGKYTNAVVTGGTLTAGVNTRSILRTLAATNSFTITGMTISGQGYTGVSFIQSAGDDTITFTNNSVTLNNAIGYFVSAPSGKTGALTFSGNTVSLLLTDAGAAINVAAGSWSTNISNNTITITSASQNYMAVNVMDQINPLIDGNTIEVWGVAQSIWAGSTGVACGTIRVTNNTVKHHNESWHAIVVGSDNDPGSGVYNKMDNAVIEGNTVYGPNYYAAADTGVHIHAILFGYGINASIRFNRIYGAGYGVVVKGTGQTWTAGGVFYNYIRDNTVAWPYPGIYVKGQSGVKIYNNTIQNTLTVAAGSTWSNGIRVDANVAGQNSTGCDIKNNLVVFAQTYALLWQGTAPNTFDYNLSYSPTFVNGGNFAYSGGGWKTWTQWQGLPQDAHGLNADPKVNADGTLQAGSPALGAGVYISGVSTANPPNIGAK